MRHEARFNTFFALFGNLLCELTNISCEFARIGGVELSCNCGEAKHTRSAKSDGLGSLAFDPDRLMRRRIVIHSYLVSVLIAALIDDLLHFGAGFGRKSKCLYTHL